MKEALKTRKGCEISNENKNLVFFHWGKILEINYFVISFFNQEKEFMITSIGLLFIQEKILNFLLSHSDLLILLAIFFSSEYDFLNFYCLERRVEMFS